MSKTKNSPPSSHHAPVDRCPSCGRPCNIEKDLDDKDYCNDCRPAVIETESGVKMTSPVVNNNPAALTIADAISQSFVCKGCGEKQPFPKFPIDILKFTRVARKFMKKHQNCKLKTETDGK